jgi:hypothetical protein
LGLWLTLDAGKFRAVEFDPRTGRLRVGLNPADEFTPAARLHVQQPTAVEGVGKYQPALQFQLERGAYVVPVGEQVVWLELFATEAQPN